MPAGLDDLPAIDDANQVRPLDRRQPMRNDERRAPADQDVQRLLHLPFRFAVEGRSRFVEQQDRRVLQHRARNGNSLTLAAGQSDAVLADHRIVALRQLANERVGGSRARRFLDFGRGCAKAAIGDIGAHSVVEQADFLSDQRDRAAQRGDRHRAHILPVDCDASRFDVEESRDQVEHGRFSRSQRADQRHGLAGRDRQ